MKFRQTNKQKFTHVNWLFVVPLAFLFNASGFPPKKEVITGYNASIHSRECSPGEDTVQSVRYINTSSLERLPAVIRDLTTAINESYFIRELLGDKGLSVFLYDMTCSSVNFSASVQYHVNDSIYRVRINTINRQAKDIALATTLIHETMHCLLLNLYDRARKFKARSVVTALNFALDGREISDNPGDVFFDLMNMGEAGQHELMYRLLHPQMKTLLKRFAALHKTPFFERWDLEFLTWSGLQNTEAYRQLPDEERRKIEVAILTAKGIYFDGN